MRFSISIVRWRSGGAPPGASKASARKSAPMSSTLQQWSMETLRSALRGIEEAVACDGSCTIVTPPRSLMASKPAVPSSS
ncbi:MAG TPA: hypothetical protein VFV75_04090 [Candidatus Polarisedimenticolaceae bacterium]|nr:hypothetical protein [Candidatus Polarisedimenticolaceae bacterium]